MTRVKVKFVAEFRRKKRLRRPAPETPVRAQLLGCKCPRRSVQKDWTDAQTRVNAHHVASSGVLPFRHVLRTVALLSFQQRERGGRMMINAAIRADERKAILKPRNSQVESVRPAQKDCGQL